MDTIVDVPPGALADAATDRQEFFPPDAGRRGRPHAEARPHRVRRNRQQTQQLSSRGSVRRPSAPGEPVPDETLLAGLRDGDVCAGDTLVARYAPQLLRYLQRLAGPDLAEELHQQTWVSVLDHVGRFQSAAATGTAPSGTAPCATGTAAAGAPVAPGGGGFRAWLFRIATNKVNDVWRSRGRERNAKDGLKRILDDRAPHAGTRAEASEQGQKLAGALSMLPREQREALTLRFYSGMKFTEIAQVVGCPVNTALTRVHKGILKLRQMMEAE
jgi:RNA polymerase sigma-70 factor (ECF subfamily)